MGRREAVGAVARQPSGGFITGKPRGGRVKRRENRVYRLLGGTRGGQVGKYQGLFRKFAQSFRPITAEEASSIEELRVRSARALPGETLTALSTRTNNQWDLTFTSVANGVFAHEALAPDQRIKIAVKEHYERAPSPQNPTAEPAPNATAPLVR